MLILESLTMNFITNSSSLSAIITFDTYNAENIICNKKVIENKIKRFFNKFLTEDLHLSSDTINGAYSEFVNSVKKYIFAYSKILCKLLKNFDDGEIRNLSVSVDRDGNGIDTTEPEKYAIFFIIKYILRDIAENYNEYGN